MKIKVSMTLDEDVVRALNKHEELNGVKVSTYANRVLRRHFKRPGKGKEAVKINNPLTVGAAK
jgi:hypothetical protein